jgi:hypothetical protein
MKAKDRKFLMRLEAQPTSGRIKAPVTGIKTMLRITAL